MSFLKGYIPWNKGKKCLNISEKMKGKIPWNKGIKMWKNKKHPLLGKKFSKEHRKKISIGHKGQIPWNPKGSKRPDICGEKHPNWKGGLWTSEYRKNHKREYRHKIGECKKYIRRSLGLKSFTKKEYRQRRKALMKGGGELPVERIQMVYEDNIKQYGTLTCIYCLNPIQFGQDTLEHKQPLSCGGDNEYNNLAIACQKCNSSKGKKTEEEYRKEILLWEN